MSRVGVSALENPCRSIASGVPTDDHEQEPGMGSQHREMSLPYLPTDTIVWLVLAMVLSSAAAVVAVLHLLPVGFMAMIVFAIAIQVLAALKVTYDMIFRQCSACKRRLVSTDYSRSFVCEPCDIRFTVSPLAPWMQAKGGFGVSQPGGIPSSGVPPAQARKSARARHTILLLRGVALGLAGVYFLYLCCTALSQGVVTTRHGRLAGQSDSLFTYWIEIAVSGITALLLLAGAYWITRNCILLMRVQRFIDSANRLLESQQAGTPASESVSPPAPTPAPPDPSAPR